MSKHEEKLIVEGKEIFCPICGYDKYWTRETLMNTAGASFLGFDWANKAAMNYVCNQCGYVLWFLKK
ncbi:hypothetical protein SAMN05660297_00816 [Natronincola peptidivorans]|uniref:DNA-binding protein n=1 Tax=Natronincola peptidivorans TaxID=426128 RepID=A0A1I0A173_9FIRM|nr:hypothetical protein [Natronincola peptidivorans]SES87690.1 hypothetical protein SAMN05660297_00816 [Natronincola peptidivorans]